jgi:hypothetical protein
MRADFGGVISAALQTTGNKTPRHGLAMLYE